MNDSKVGLAALLTIGFVSLIALAMFAPIGEGSQRIVDGSLGALGVALGNAIAGIFRSDRVDEQRAANTGTALDTIRAGIEAQPPAKEPIE